MGPDETEPGAFVESEAMPERWETAVEDLAQLVALGLDRAQDLADVINDLVRARPALAKAIVAAIAGAAVGVFLADRLGPRRAARQRTRPSAHGSSQETTSLFEEALTAAQEAIELLARRRPTGAAIVESLARADGSGWRARVRVSALGQMRHVAQLLPVTLTLLRNPLVRHLLVRSVLRAARRG